MKSSNTNNPIYFNSKKQELEDLHKKEYFIKKKSRNTYDNSHKILKYPSKSKKSLKKLVALKDILKTKFMKSGIALKILISCLILIALLCTIDKLLNFDNSTNLSSNTLPKFASESIYIPASEESTYSNIIAETIKKYSGVNYKIKSDAIHKNGNRVYATGYFNDPAEGKIYFDIVLLNNNPESLVINGIEYIK